LQRLYRCLCACSQRSVSHTCSNSAILKMSGSHSLRSGLWVRKIYTIGRSDTVTRDDTGYECNGALAHGCYPHHPLDRYLTHLDYSSVSYLLRCSVIPSFDLVILCVCFDLCRETSIYSHDPLAFTFSNTTVLTSFCVNLSCSRHSGLGYTWLEVS
jgi:hypothetical protein